MVLDYIAIGLIVISLIVIMAIIWKKFPVVAAIKTETLQRHKQERIKKGLIEDRLKRKLRLNKLPPMFRSGDADRPSLLSRAQQALKEVEHRYRNRIRELEPSNTESSDRKKTLLLEEAKKLTEQESYKDAEAKLIEAISLDSKYTEAYDELAELYTEQKDYDHAEEIYQYLIKMHSSQESTSSNTSSGDANQNAVSLNKAVADYHVELGEVYLAQDRKMDALTCFKEAGRLEPNNPRVLDHLIATAVTLGDKELAKIHYDKLKEANPENEKLKEFQAALKKMK